MIARNSIARFIRDCAALMLVQLMRPAAANKPLDADGAVVFQSYGQLQVLGIIVMARNDLLHGAYGVQSREGVAHIHEPLLIFLRSLVAVRRPA